MPRVSSAPEDAYHLSGKFADGWGKVIDCKSVVFQFPPTKETKGNRLAGHQDPAGLFAEITIQRYNDGDGNMSAGQPETKLLGIQKVSPDTGVLDKVRPGNFPDGDINSEPVDAGSELGAEGNTVFAIADGFQFNDKCGWMTFTQSLVEDGFKPAVLKRTYFPDLVGLYAYFETVTKPKFRADQTDDPTAFVVKKGTTKIYPYEKQTAGAKATAKAGKAPAAAPAAAKPPAAATPAAAAASSNGAGDPEAIATAILTDTVAPAQKGVLFPDMKKLKVTVFLAINKHKPAVPAELKKAVQDQLGNLEWLQAVGEGNELFSVGEDGSVQFA